MQRLSLAPAHDHWNPRVTRVWGIKGLCGHNGLREPTSTKGYSRITRVTVGLQVARFLRIEHEEVS